MSFSPAVLKSAASLKMGRLGLQLSKASPEILTVAGVVGLVGAGVLVARATIKSVPVIETLKQNKLDINNAFAAGKIDEKTKNKGITQEYTRAALGFAKNYGPAVTLGLASISCLLGAQGILKKRNAAMAAAYKTVEESLNKYRDRVRDELGEDQERELFHGVEEKEIINPETDEKSIVKVGDPNQISGYAKFFDEWNKNWEKTPEYNLLFLQAQQNFANQKLQAVGHLFLNEVYEALGLPHTQAGAVVGWVLDKDSDNFVDFGIFTRDDQQTREFVNGYERSILLDFNVDGLIFDKI